MVGRYVGVHRMLIFTNSLQVRPVSEKDGWRRELEKGQATNDCREPCGVDGAHRMEREERG